MDYIDPVTTQEPTTESQISNTTNTSSAAPHDTATIKTEETIEKLESEIDKAYVLVEHKFQELWENASKNAEKYHLEEYKQNFIEQLNTTKQSLNEKTSELHVQESLKSIEDQLKKIKLQDISTQANSALDVLDSKLEVVEREAGKYFGNFTTFLSNIVSISPGDDSTNNNNNNANQKTKEVLFNSSLNQYNNYGTTRYDTDLLKLHTTEEFYLSDELDDENEIKNFNADEKTKEISDLLEKYSTTLTKTMNELVPVKIAYNLFWYRYFKQENKLKEHEKKRKELLQKKEGSKHNHVSTDGDDEEDFTWDDDDEEEEEEEAEEKKESTGGKSTKEAVPEKESSKNDTTAKAAEDEEDEDWE